MPQKSEILVKEFASKSSGPIDIENRQIRVLASNGDIDRDGERVLPSAFEPFLKQYMTNPVILCSHSHRLDGGEPPVVGRAVKTWIDEKGLWVIIEFARSELAERWWNLYSTDFMRAVSVSFIPKKWRDEIVNGERVRTYTLVELIEISLCAVPANRGALARSKQNKLDFVQGKRDEKILEEIKAEYTRQGRDFDVEAEEFAELLMTGNQGLGEIQDRKEIDYISLVKR
jgi:HK97 family phage prohead protease